jgi:ubiquinone/menaquinone biosynthesis C-methylase UbiE
VRFVVASMTDLPLADAGLAGLVAWYSIIHLPPEVLPAVFAEFHRVLAPGGELLLAFKAGDKRIRLEQAYGHTVSYDVHWLPPDRIAAQLAAAGFAVHSRLVREPEGYERGPQAYLLARRPRHADPA